MSMTGQPEVLPERTLKPVRKRGFFARLFNFCFLLVILAILGWTAWVYHGIKSTAQIDNAQTADAIAVFGAAEYAGRPSPVLHARLDKAVALYNRGIAPVIITLGGGGDKDSGNSEGAVG